MRLKALFFIPRFTLLLQLLACSFTAIADSYPGNGELINVEAVTLVGDLRAREHLVKGTPGFLDKVEISVIYYRSDGMIISGCLIEPRNDGRYPAIIFNHGGNRNFGALNFNGRMRKLLTLADLAAQGFVVIASQYRGVANNPGRDEFGGGDVNDVLNLIPLIENHPKADAARIGMWGESRGGMMTYLALRQTRRIKAAVITAGAADLVADLDRRPEMEQVFRELIGGSDTEMLARLKQRSAVYWAHQLPKSTPILLQHGTADWRVSPNDSLRVALKLLEANIPFRLVMFEGADHGLTEFSVEARQQVAAWFKHYLAEEAVLPDLTPHGP